MKTDMKPRQRDGEGGVTVGTTDGGLRIRCDGDGCGETARPAVALRALLSPSAADDAGLLGWLFVARNGTTRHYCPRCSVAVLRGVAPGVERGA